MNRRAAHHVPYHLSRGEQVGMDERMRKSDSFRSDRGKQMATQASMRPTRIFWLRSALVTPQILAGIGNTR